MLQEYIVIKGARENNLKNVSLRVPKRKITIFTGVSGSGKSSIVFDTISSEARRQLNETFTAFIRNRLPRYSRPDADAIENLATAIVVDQKRLGANSRSTIGTITDIYSLLRLLFSRIGQPYIGYSHMFSFNDPAGMCPACDGIGRQIELDVRKLLDPSRSLNEGGIRFPVFAVGTWYWKTYTLSGLFDNDKKLADYSEEEWHTLLCGKGRKIALPSKGGPVHSDFEGVVDKFTRLYIKRDSGELSEKVQHQVQQFIRLSLCPKCHGSRLGPEALSCKINGYNIAEHAALEIGELMRTVRDICDPVAAPIIESLTERLQHMIDMGLDYLSLNRETATLSGGECQRLKLAGELHKKGRIYVMDEPTTGLHVSDVGLLLATIDRLVDGGSSVIVIEHHADVIKRADWIIDMGPDGGHKGGHVVFEGTPLQLLRADRSITGAYLRQSQNVV